MQATYVALTNTANSSVLKRIRQHSIVFTALLVLALFTPTLHANGDQSSGKKRLPNIVIIFTDDQGYADVGVFGAKNIKTPNLDRMAKRGVRFTDFYVSTAVCSASRAALMTGCYHARVGLHGALSPQAKIGLHPNETTIAELMQQVGYRCGCFGKWHLGRPARFLPTSQGFDEYFGLPYSNDMSPDPKNNPRKRARKHPPLPLLDGTKVIEKEPDQTQLTKRYTKRAVQFIEKNKSRPFFCYLAHSMPHVPLYASTGFKGKSKGGLYGDVIEEIDWSVGQILTTLQKHGLEENTLVIFTSDNGPWLTFGNHGGSAGPLREGKGTIFEGGVRVPCIMYWPGTIPGGSTCRQPAMTIDILPTLAHLSGAKLPKNKIDGKNIWPLIKGERGAKSPHEAYFFWYARELRAVRMGKWKLHFPHKYRTQIAPPGKDGLPAGQGVGHIGLSLFDLEKDIGEKTNLQAKYPAIVQHMTALAKKMQQRLGDKRTKQLGTEARPVGQQRKQIQRRAVRGADLCLATKLKREVTEAED